VRHPVHTLLAEHAYHGTEPTEEELAELQLTPADRRLVSQAAREAAFAWAGGDHANANEHALQQAHEIVAALPPAQRSPRYLHVPDDLAGLGPAELAARIPRP
jgi:hypothetical protein